MVNNAIVAGRHSNGLLETEPEDWDALMDVGLRGGRSLDLLTSAPARLRQPTPPRAA
jgi:NAD(P)-dependent dehydrogenase (short-subunit alcohol dehydrogenase family)